MNELKNILKNFFSLSLIQGLNLIIPLISLPILIGRLGIEKFGLINFALSNIMYFNILISYGFDLYATREISINKDPNSRSTIFSSIFFIKIVLLILSFLIFLLLVFFIKHFQTNLLLYIFTISILISNPLHLNWFFMGIEEMQLIAFPNLSLKIISLFSIIIFIKGPNDYLYVPLINSIAAIIGGGVSFFIAIRLYEVRIHLITINIIFKTFMNSFSYFLSRLASNGSRYFTTTIIGSIYGATIVGYFSLVEKLYYVFLSLSSVISQTFYPYMSRTKNLIFFKKAISVVLILILSTQITLIFLNRWLFLTFFNLESPVLSKMFIIVISFAIFNAISILIGYPILAGFGYSHYANMSLVYASIIYCILLIAFSFVYKNIYLTVLCLPFYGMISLLIRLYYIRKYKILDKTLIIKNSKI